MIFSEEDHIPVVDPNKDYFAELVGEDKPYKDEKAAARAIVEKEAFIKRLQKENAEMRDSMKGRESLEALIDKLATKDVKMPDPAIQTPDEDQPQLSEEKILELIDKKSREEAERRLREDNQKRVRERLLEAHGSNAQGFYQTKAQELGGVAFLDDIAARNPEALFRVLGLDAPNKDRSPPKTSVNTSGFRLNTGEKNYKYYQTLRAELTTKGRASEYWDPRIQNEMMENAQRMGSQFYE